jgi:2-oxoglutarate ferredoxin oxidoreductase subunit delta
MMTPRAERKQVQIRIDENLCKGCDICIEFCPLNVFEVSRDLSRRGYYVPKVVREEDCNGCGICDLLCPDLAIILIKEVETD